MQPPRSGNDDRQPFSLLISLLGAVLLLFGPELSAQEAKKPDVRFEVWCVTVSANGEIVVGSGGMWDAPGEIGVWNLATRKPLKRFTENLGVCSVALSPDGKLLASGSWTGHVRLRDWEAGIELADFAVAGAARVAFSPNGALLATATESKTVQLWDVSQRKHLADLKGDLFRFHCVKFSPDGKRVLAGGGDWKTDGLNQVTIWDVASKQQVLKLVGHRNAIVCLTFSPDGNTIATGSVDNTIRLWDADSGQQLKVLPGHKHWVESLVFTADGKTLISGSHDRTIRYWDVEQGTERDRIVMPGDVRTVELTPDGKFLLGGGALKTLKVFDAASRQELDVLWNGPDAPKVAMDDLPVAVPEKIVKRSWWAVAVFLGLILVASVVLVLWFLRRKVSGTVMEGS